MNLSKSQHQFIINIGIVIVIIMTIAMVTSFLIHHYEVNEIKDSAQKKALESFANTKPTPFVGKYQSEITWIKESESEDDFMKRCGHTGVGQFSIKNATYSECDIAGTVIGIDFKYHVNAKLNITSEPGQTQEQIINEKLDRLIELQQFHNALHTGEYIGNLEVNIKESYSDFKLDKINYDDSEMPDECHYDKKYLPEPNEWMVFYELVGCELKDGEYQVLEK